MPKLPKEKLDARRDGILGAALRCLERNGLGGTGMRALFRAANLSPGAVYRYFASKEELLAAAAERAPGPLAAALDEAASDRDPAAELATLVAAAAVAPGNRLRLELLTAALGSTAVAHALRERLAGERRRLEAALTEAAGPAASREATAVRAELVEALALGLAARRLLEPDYDPAPACAAAAGWLATG